MDAVLGFIHDNMLVLGFIWGLVCKYVPKLKGIPNATIPYVNALLSLLTGLAGPATAGAAVLGLSIPGHTLLGQLLGAAWTAIQSALIYEVFARAPLEKAGVKKP